MRVLHLTDTLGGGGVERMLWDTVRLSDPRRVAHRVVTFFPDGYFGPFVYAERLRQAGAYGCLRNEAKGDGASKSVHDLAAAAATSDETPAAKRGTGLFRRAARRVWGGVRDFALSALRKLPSSWKRGLGSILSAARSMWYAASAGRHRLFSAASLYLPASRRILVEYLRFRPDVIHVHGFYPFAYGIFFKALFRRPVVHTVPSMFAQMTEQGTGWLPDQYRRYHRWVDNFFLVPAYRAELLGVGVPAEKLFNLCGSVNVLEAVEAKAANARHRAEVRARLGIPSDSLIALSVGRLDPSKGHQYALEALPSMLGRCPHLHWVVLGEGWKRAELEARVKELGVERHAHLVGFIDDPLPFYAAADIFLRTMVFEGDNLSSCAAMAVGLPVVGFETGNESDLIRKVGHGIPVPNRDAAALAAAATQILALPDRGGALGALGADYCRTHLDFKRDVDNFVSTYISLHLKNKNAAYSSMTHSDEVSP